MTEQTLLVIGAGGLVGRSVCALLTERPIPGVAPVAIGRRRPQEPCSIPWRTADIGVSDDALDLIASAAAIIWVAGGSDHGLGDRDPQANLRVNVNPLLAALSRFRGHLVMLSSQAVYFGLSGLTPEDVDHIPQMPYGMAKMVAEQHAMWARGRGDLAGLWIHRLMYTYGPGEAPRRLLPRLATAGRQASAVSVSGGGRSFVNPLPTSFVAEVLCRSAADLIAGRVEDPVITNVCHPRPVTVRDVVEAVQPLTGATVEYVSGGEPWPVTFRGDTERLQNHLKRWDLSFPDPYDPLLEYVYFLREENLK